MKKADRIVPATQGAGPLLQRDYWAVIENAIHSPSDLVRLVRRHFEELAPEEVAAFARKQGAGEELELNAEFDIRIALAGKCKVRLVHADELSFTLRTLAGHPEAGRITFGASSLEDGRLEFRIRSRARAADTLRFFGYELLGKSMQTDTWVEFVARVVRLSGGISPEGVQIAEREVDDSEADSGEIDLPTFVPRVA